MDENILSDLEYPMSRSKMNARNIEDIIDGDVYQKHFAKDGFICSTREDAKNKQNSFISPVKY